MSNMGEIAFSDKQREVIDTRDKNILVSAAAGSGKTAVLVQRIIERVLDKASPVDIDQILVLTFTEAAAGEMRERVERAINDKLLEEPDDERIARQAVLVHNAQISTIHGFCLSLIKNNFTQIDLDPSFRVAEEGEIKLVQGQVLDELIEDLFETDTVNNFELLADRFVAKNSLDRLKETILEAYEECRNNPFVRDYMEERRGDYACMDAEHIFETSWGAKLKEYTKLMLNEAGRLAKSNIDFALSGNGPYMYKEALESDLKLIERLLKCNTYGEYFINLGSIEFARLSTKKDSAVSEEAKNYSKELRADVKGIISGLEKDFYHIPTATLLTGMEANSAIVNALVDVLEIFDERFEEEKKKRKIIDFSDMEHFALKILLAKEDGKYVATQAARDYREVYKEIMVDEYQDSNYVQEYILKSISGEEDGIYNRFMVGDVKQSIYSFRNACPELFMDKYEQYSSDDINNVRIDLSTNYRSRIEVLNSVNHIFERIMAQDLGGIEYTDEVRLNLGADYPLSGGDYKTELLLLKQDGVLDEKKQQQEAKMVAQKINSLVNGPQPLMVKDGDTQRKCRYSDIVILLRSNKGWDDIFKNELENYGIPAYIASKTGYFSAKEVQLLLNLLQVMDNPRNEIELFGVLTSIFAGFDKEEIAAIRAISKIQLIDAISDIADEKGEFEDKIDERIAEKCRIFLAFLKKYRKKMVYTPINELLEEIIRETGYMNYIASLPFGEQRGANVYMLIEKAKQYETGSFKGLYHFVRYIKEIRSYEVDFGEASILDEQSDVVRIMSIHKSKGLEFPVCFVCGLNKQFNEMDAKNEVVYNKELGIGLDFVDPLKNIKYQDLRRKFLGKCLKEEGIAEEIRILYVAMTRAKEKLIMTACVNDIDDVINAAGKYKDEDNKKALPYFARIKCSSYLDLVLSAIDAEDDAFISVNKIDSLVFDSVDIEAGVSREQRKQLLLVDIDSLEEHGDNDAVNVVKNKIMFKYLHDNLRDLYTKTSVSELKMAAIHAHTKEEELEDKPVELFSDNSAEAYVPKFVKTEEKISGTTRGSAYHKVAELFFSENDADFTQLGDDNIEQHVAHVVENMCIKKRINTEDAKLVDRGKFADFVKSDLASRMYHAYLRKDLHLEEPFVLGVSASRLMKTFPEDETVLIQGIIDGYFIEEGEIVLMDYKTDNVADERELIDRYRVQLDYYKEALENITGLRVKEQLIYSFRFGKVIDINA